MSIEDDIVCLEGVPTLRLLGPNALRMLAIGCESRKLHKDEVLFMADDPADCGYVIQHGSFQLERPRRNRQARRDDASRVMIAGPGVLLGELALIIEIKRPVTAIAAEPAIVMRIPRNLFRKTLEGFPDAAERLRDHMAARARDTAVEISVVSKVLDHEPDQPIE
ncbi:MAG: Crp/Fnr family transcriptional regulator [Xanthobacteraceae bacterium]